MCFVHGAFFSLKRQNLLMNRHHYLHHRHFQGLGLRVLCQSQYYNPNVSLVDSPRSFACSSIDLSILHTCAHLVVKLLLPKQVVF